MHIANAKHSELILNQNNQIYACLNDNHHSALLFLLFILTKYLFKITTKIYDFVNLVSAAIYGSTRVKREVTQTLVYREKYK